MAEKSRRQAVIMPIPRWRAWLAVFRCRHCVSPDARRRIPDEPQSAMSVARNTRCRMYRPSPRIRLAAHHARSGRCRFVCRMQTARCYTLKQRQWSTRSGCRPFPQTRRAGSTQDLLRRRKTLRPMRRARPLGRACIPSLRSGSDVPETQRREKRSGPSPTLKIRVGSGSFHRSWPYPALQHSR